MIWTNQLHFTALLSCVAQPSLGTMVIRAASVDYLRVGLPNADVRVRISDEQS